MQSRRSTLKTGAAALAAAALPAAAAAPKPDPKLAALFDQFVKENLDLSPITATSLGLDVGARAHQRGETDDSSLAGIARNKAVNASQLKRLKAFDRAALQGADVTNYDVVLYGLQTSDDANRRFAYGPGGAGQPYVISQLTGSYQNTPSFLDSQQPMETKADADAYLARLAEFAVVLDQESEVARHDIALGVVPPDFALTKTLLQMSQLRAAQPDKSNLVLSLTRRAGEKKIAGDWGAAATKVVTDKVYPALDRQIALVKEMQKHATHDAGVWKLADGDAYYRDSLTIWATTSKSPQEIHQLGLDIVAEHTALIDALMKKHGMTKGTVGQRLRAMYQDPKFLIADNDDAKAKLIVDLNAKVKTVQARLTQWFGTLPKAGLEIRRVPKNIEAGQPIGYYYPASLDGKRAGIYWINLRDAKEMPTWTLPTLTFHEGIPGHHLQLSIQQEASLPLIRKMSFFSAYIEGWALYAEQLSGEMGLYQDDDFGRIGQLHDAMFRGVRLVLDSGMHALKWSREKSVKYYTDTLGDPESSAITEVERYCVWPGQACTYMLGKLTFLAERDKARKALGAKFDIRKFHDAMLLQGAMPLKLLDGVTARYIADAGRT